MEADRNLRYIAYPGAAVSPSLLGGIRSTIAKWRQRIRERNELMTLTAPDLKDIGVSQAEAKAEAQKPFWRP
jgi:uncharacterized protein YjiS (DUF1127 family)